MRYMRFLEKLKDKILDIHESMDMEKRTITRKDDEPYLTRYYLFRKPVKWMPSLYLHCFHASDEDPELHNHPWDNSFSIILSGSYREEYRDKLGMVRSRFVKPGMFNFVSADKFHRIDLETDEVYTLFFSGRKTQGWGFWNRNTSEYVDWKEHERIKALKAAAKRGADKATSSFEKLKELRNLSASDIINGEDNGEAPHGAYG